MADVTIIYSVMQKKREAFFYLSTFENSKKKIDPIK